MQVRTIERLLLILTAALYGCSAETTPRATHSSQEAARIQQVVPANCPKVGVILPRPDPNLPWQFDHKSALEREFRLQLPDVQVNLVAADANNDSQLQVARGVIDGGACILLVSAESDSTAVMIYRMAQAKGIPVVAYDGPVPDPESAIRVGFDYHYAGILVGRWIERQLPQDYGVLVLSGPDDDYGSRHYKEGLMQRLTALIQMGRIRQVNTLTWNSVSGAQPDSEWAHSLISARLRERWLVCAPTPDMATALADFDQSTLGPDRQTRGVYVIGAGLSLNTIKAVASGRLSMAIGFDAQELAMHAVRVVGLVRRGASTVSVARDTSAINATIYPRSILVRPVLVDAETLRYKAIDYGTPSFQQLCSSMSTRAVAGCE